MRLRFRDKNPPSRQERRFLLYWQSLGGPQLKCEFTFHPTRRWRADFAHIESRTLIEIEGGIWIQGRHNSPPGFAADAEKYLEAALAGWRLLCSRSNSFLNTLARAVAHTLSRPSDLACRLREMSSLFFQPFDRVN